MIKATPTVLFNPTLTMTLQKLAQQPLNGHTAYKLKKLLDKISEKTRDISNEYKATIVKDWSAVDEKGHSIPEQNRHGFKFKEGTDEEKLDAEVTAFNAKEYEIQRDPLTLRDLTDVKLSAAEITALGPILADPEETADNVTPLKGHQSSGAV